MGLVLALSALVPVLSALSLGLQRVVLALTPARVLALSALLLNPEPVMALALVLALVLVLVLALSALVPVLSALSLGL